MAMGWPGHHPKRAYRTLGTLPDQAGRRDGRGRWLPRAIGTATIIAEKIGCVRAWGEAGARLIRELAMHKVAAPDPGRWVDGQGFASPERNEDA